MAGRGESGKGVLPGIRRTPIATKTKAPQFPIGTIRRMITRETPGRDSAQAPPPKPTEEESPHRSRMFVDARHSADGNSYRKGDPIPEAEAERQRVGLRIAREPGNVRIPKHICPRCRGAGNHQRPGHKPGCGCPGCRSCALCKGTGRVSEEVYRGSQG